MRTTAAVSLSAALAVLLAVAGPAGAEGPIAHQDWPMYRGNAARSGYTANAAPDKLALVCRTDDGQGCCPVHPTAVSGI